MQQAFSERGLKDPRFDFIVSHYCFCHLLDSLKVFIDAYNLLHPNGIMLVDSFPIYYDEATPQTSQENDQAPNRLLDILLMLREGAGIEFLMRPTRGDRDRDTITMVRKPASPSSFTLPLSYSTLISYNPHLIRKPGDVIFTRNYPMPVPSLSYDGQRGNDPQHMLGTEDLYKWYISTRQYNGFPSKYLNPSCEKREKWPTESFLPEDWVDFAEASPRALQWRLNQTRLIQINSHEDAEQHSRDASVVNPEV